MIETPSRLIDEDVERSVDFGRGGGDWGDDPWDGWGWWDDSDDGEAWPRQRRSRMRRTVALVTAVTVVATSIGTGVVLLADKGPSPFAVSSIRASIEPSTPGAATDPHIHLQFVVTNTGAEPKRASCQATLFVDKVGTEAATVTTPVLRAGTSVPVDLRVPIPGRGTWVRSVEVACSGTARPEQAPLDTAFQLLPGPG